MMMPEFQVEGKEHGCIRECSGSSLRTSQIPKRPPLRFFRLTWFPLILASIFLVFIISVHGTLGSEEYSLDAWSDDIQITNDTGGDYPWKQWLVPRELADGSLNVLYSNEEPLGEGRYCTLSSVMIDKLGDPGHGKETYPFYRFRTMIGFSNQIRNVFYDYDEFGNSVKMMYWRGDFLRLYSYENDTDLLHNWTFSLSEAGYSTNHSTIPRTRFMGPYYGCLDDLGSAHIVVRVVTDYPDGTNQSSILYLFVNWDPFYVRSKVIVEFPREEDSGYNRHGYGSCLVLTEDGRPVIGHERILGDEFYRAISVMDGTGNWSTHILYKEPHPAYGNTAWINGLMVDEDDIVHMVWIDYITQMLMYINATLDGQWVSSPVEVTRIPWYGDVGVPTGWTQVDVEKSAEGDLIFAYNKNVYTAKYTAAYADRLDPAEIDLVVVPGGDFSVPVWDPIPLVTVPTASECQLLVDDDDNLFLFWVDQRTGSPQLYMKYRARPGIAVEIDPNAWLTARFIRPNETKVIPLDLRNVGTLDLDTAVYVESNASWDWDLSLSRYRARLEAFSSVPVKLTIHCPSDARHGEAIEVWVNATTPDRLYTSTLRLLVFVQWARELGVYCEQRYQVVDPGLTATYTVVMQNSGELAERVVVGPTGVGPADWTLGPEEFEVSLEPGGTYTFEVLVTAPVGGLADDIHTTVLEFSWSDGGTAHTSLNLRTVVRPTFFVTMLLNRTIARVDPGEVASFCVTVGNVGNLPGKAYVEVAVLTEPGEWMVLLSAETVVLDAGATRLLELLIGAPEVALGGDIMVVRLRAYCPNPFSEVVADARVEIRKVHSLTWSPGPLSWELDPTDKGGRLFSLANGGNLFETVDFRMDGVEPGWAWWVEEDFVEVDMVRLGPGEERELMLWISVPTDAGAGLHRLRLYVEALGATLGHVDLEVSVRYVGDLDLHVRAVRWMSYPGGHVEMSLEVQNLGNGPDVVNISALAPALHDVRLLVGGVNATSVWVPRGGSREVILWGRVNESASAGEHGFDVMASSTKDPTATAVANGTFEVVLPGLQVVFVELSPSRPGPGDIVTVRVMLLNDGPLEVVNVSVSMEGAEMESIAMIAPDGEAIAVFTWVPLGSGDVTLAGVVSYGPGNHSVSWSQDVPVGGEDTTTNAWWPFILATVAVVVLIISFTYRQRTQVS